MQIALEPSMERTRTALLPALGERSHPSKNTLFECGGGSRVSRFETPESMRRGHPKVKGDVSNRKAIPGRTTTHLPMGSLEEALALSNAGLSWLSDVE